MTTQPPRKGRMRTRLILTVVLLVLLVLVLIFWFSQPVIAPGDVRLIGFV